MKYIVYRHFKDLAICGYVDLPIGAEFDSSGEILTLNGEIVTRIFSDNYCSHFSRNNDGKGFERGKLIYAIAYSDRKADNGFRFSDHEQEILRRDWAHYLMPYDNALLFNNAFYDAPIEVLTKIAQLLGVI